MEDRTKAVDDLIALGQPLEDRGECALALEIYREALRLAPAYPRVQLNIANALQRMGRIDEGIAALLDALEIDAGFLPARFNLGIMRDAQGQFAAAEADFRECLRLNPDFAEAHIALADTLEARGNLAEAVSHLQRALVLKPEHNGAAYNLGLLLQKCDRFDEAARWMLRAKELDPIAARGAAFAYCWELNYRDDLDPRTIFAEHVRMGRAIAREAGPPMDIWTNARTLSRPLRIGYVSADFRLHPIGILVGQLLKAHNRDHFSVHCYSNGDAADRQTDVIRSSADAWRSVARLDDVQAAELIRSDGIDVLVDLSGHTTGTRLPVFARRAAPVQVTWAGYLNTSGLDTMDYRICDRFTDPIGETEALHTEALFRMPDSQWCYVPMMDVVPPARSRSADGIVTFGSFNQYRKIGPRCFELWSRVLARVPRSRLVIHDVDAARIRRILTDGLAERGIDPSRVSTRGRMGIADYFRALADVDVSLDTHPYNGATTTLDALWMGTPVVALRGDRGIARGAYGILRSAGLPELIAHTEGEYVEINARLATDETWRMMLSRSLRSRLAASPLMDAGRFTADLEAGYREMWSAWCGSDPARFA